MSTIQPTKTNSACIGANRSFYSDISAAIKDAAKSIHTALQSQNSQYELKLVSRHIDLAGLNPNAKEAILAFLDPFDERYNQRVDITTCLIGFDFDAYETLSGAPSDQGDFELLARSGYRTEPNHSQSFSISRNREAFD